VCERPEYPLRIWLNGRWFRRVIIDPHYREKHGELNDLLILKLLTSLDGEALPTGDLAQGFEYVVAEPVVAMNKPYRLVLAIPDSDDYLGIVNCFRVRPKNG
jgi:hypothetical protein